MERWKLFLSLFLLFCFGIFALVLLVSEKEEIHRVEKKNPKQTEFRQEEEEFLEERDEEEKKAEEEPEQKADEKLRDLDGNVIFNGDEPKQGIQ